MYAYINTYICIYVHEYMHTLYTYNSSYAQ